MKRANVWGLAVCFGLFAAAAVAGRFEAIPVLVEQENGSFTPLLDERGHPVFEISGMEYVARPPVKRPTSTPLPRAKLIAETEEKRPGLLGSTLLGPATENAYGPDLHSDATGRPFRYRTQDGEAAIGSVKQNGYGLGIHADQFGRPVYAVPE